MLRIWLLGVLRLEVDGVELTPPSSRRARLLLAMLALDRHSHARAKLAAQLWPDVLDESARVSLRTALVQLRAALGTGADRFLLADRERVALAGDEAVWTDVGELERLLAGGEVEAALELAGDELLAGLEDDWVYERRDALRDRIAEALAAAAADAEARGDLAAAARLTRRQAALDPLAEEPHRELIRRLYEAGDHGAALSVHEALRERLSSELGIVPSPETRELVERVRAGQARARSAEPTPPSPFPPILGRQRRPFVGRDSDLRELQRLWERSRGGAQTLAFLAGEPGIGKTRLAGELAQRLHGEGATVLYGRSYEENLTAYQPFVEALGDLTRLLPEHAHASGADPAGDRYRLFEAVAALLGDTAERGPLLLILDDLHWADRPTLLLLRHIVRHPVELPLLILGTYRATELSQGHRLWEALGDLRRERGFKRLSLDGLDEEEIRDMSADWLGSEPPAGFARTVRAETAGNPFFVEEVLRHVLASEAGAEASLASTPSIVRIGIPEGVQEMIRARLAQLSDGAAGVLEVAAVIGQEFPTPVLERVSGLPTDDFDAALDEATRQHLISALPGRVPRYVFAHALIREALYRQLGAARCARLHLRIGEALEELRTAEGEGDPSELAHHFFEAAKGAALLDKAIDYSISAGEQAGAQLAYEKAAEHYERAATALALRGGPARRQCRLLLALGESRWSAGEFAGSREAFRRAGELARESGLADELASAALGFGGRMGFEMVVLNPHLIALLEEALERLGDEDSALRARVTVRLGEALMFSPARRRAAELAATAVTTARRVGDPAVLAEVLNTASWVLWAPDNDVGERLGRAREIVTLADEQGTMMLRIEGRVWLASSLLELGDVPAFEREVDACTALAEEVRQPYYRWGVDVLNVLRAMLADPLERVERLAWRALETGQRNQIPAAAHLFGTHIFHIRLRQGRAAEVHGAARAYADAFPAVPALRCGLALLCCELGRTDDARRELERVESNGFGDIPRDFVWLSAVDLLAGVCAQLGEADRAAELYELLVPYADRHIVASAFAVPRGSVERVLGVLAATQERFDEAGLHFEAAIERNEAAGLTYAVADARYDYAAMLVARDESGDPDRALELIDGAQAGARRLGDERLMARAVALRREAQSATRGATPARRTLSEVVSRIGGDTRAAVSTRGRAVLGRLTGDVSDAALEQRFGSRIAQRGLMTAMTRSFQPRLALGFEGELALELVHQPAANGGAESDSWTIEVAGKRATARHRPAHRPAVTLHLSVAEFVRVFSGVTNPVAAWVEGRLRVEGDVLLAARIVEMFGGVNPAEVLARPLSASRPRTGG
jgi:DNA-binding SARP family transcriptional activator/tetratricopeptide (TPR) repeat protein